MRVAVEYRTNSREVYKKFCLEHPEVKIEFKKWEEVLRTFNESFRDYMLETGDRAKMPWGFGDFAVSKKKKAKTKVKDGKTYVNLAVDWLQTRKAGKYVYHFNTHTDGYSFKWYWFNRDARFFASDIWVFKAARATSRKISEYVNKKSKNYYELYKEWGRKK